MAVGESAGSVYVTIDGDASPLLAKYAQAESASRAAGQRVASAFGAGTAQATGIVDQFGRAVQSTLAPTQEMATEAVRAAAAEAGLASSTDTATSAMAHQVSQIQATSGTLRTLSGEGGIRAAERFLASIPGIGAALQSAFPLIGLLALTELIDRAAEHFGKASAAAKEFAEGMQKADQEATRLGSAIQRLDQEIFAIKFGQTAADAHESALAIDGIAAAAHRAALAMAEQQLASAKSQAQAKAATDAQLAGGLGTFEGGPALSPAANVDNDPAVKLARQNLANAQNQIVEDQKKGSLEAVKTLQSSADDTQGIYNKQTEAANKAAAAQRKLEEEGKQLSDEGLVWRNQQIEAQERSADAVQKWAERNYEANQRVNASNEETALKFQEYADKYAEYRAKIEAADAKGNLEPRPELAETPINVPLNQRLKGVTPGSQSNIGAPETLTLPGIAPPGGTAGALSASNQFSELGGKTQGQIDAQIAQQQRLKDAERDVNAPLQERLTIEQKLLDLKIQSATANGQSDNADKIAAANVGLQQTLTEWKSLGLGNAAQDIEHALTQAPQALGSALSKGVTGGKKNESVGKEISLALKGIGQNLLGQAFTQIISKLIATVVIQTGVQAAFSSIFGVGTTAQVAAQTANTIAVAANTDALIAQIALLGFADGTSSAPGGMALVGEKGPEIVNLPRGSQVIPNHKIKGYADGTPGAGIAVAGGGNIHIGSMSVHAHGVNDPNKFSEHVFRQIPVIAKRRSSQGLSQSA